MHGQWKLKCGCLFFAGMLLVVATARLARGQCTAGASNASPADEQIQKLFDEHDWAGVVRAAALEHVRTADESFAYGIALARLERWSDARAALMAGGRACPGQKRFAIELAGVAFQLKNYPEAAAWLRKGLRLDPKDEYANNFAGTVYLLMGNVNAALKYWNRVEKPDVEAINLDSQLRVRRLVLDRAFAFSPAAVLKQRDYETTAARLDGLGIFPAYNMVLNARPDGKFDADFHAVERDGFGSSRAAALISTFSGAAYETVYPSYSNVGGRAMNVESLLRWDAQKRRAWIAVSAPLNDRPEWRWQLAADARNENWAVRRSFTGDAPVLGSLNLEKQLAAGTLTDFVSGRLQWRGGAEVSHRDFRNVTQGTALTPALVAPGWELKALGGIEGKLVVIPERRFALSGAANAELARMWPRTQPAGTPDVFGKLEGAMRAQWFPQAQGETYEMQERVRAAKTFGSVPFDELYVLGMERDTDLWLRGQVGTRDGKKGSSPAANSYFVSNTDFYRRIYGNGLFSIKAGPLLDIGRAAAPTSGLAPSQWIFDVGVDVKLTVLGTSVVLTYGYDARTGSNAFYGTAVR